MRKEEGRENKRKEQRLKNKPKVGVSRASGGVAMTPTSNGQVPTRADQVHSPRRRHQTSNRFTQGREGNEKGQGYVPAGTQISTFSLQRLLLRRCAAHCHCHCRQRRKRVTLFQAKKEARNECKSLQFVLPSFPLFFFFFYLLPLLLLPWSVVCVCSFHGSW